MPYKSNEAGFTLLASAVCAVALFGTAGLAIDLGRVYITKNEAQTFADSASLYAAMELDGTSTSLTRADAAVAANANKWNFGTSSFSGTVIEYSANGSTGWATSATATPASMSYVRVTPTVNNISLFFLPVTGTATTATVKAQAIAGMTLQGTSSTNPVRNSVFPYSPVANIDTTTVVTPVAGVDPFGWVRGGQYDLKWPHSAQTGTSGANKVPCSGDNNTAMINRTDGGSEWGEIVLTSASAISAQITDDAGGISVVLGQSVNPQNGQKNSITTAFETRAAQDSNDTETCVDTDSVATCAQHLSNYLASTHNGRRLITAVVNNGTSNAAGTDYPSNQQNIGIGFAQFWLLTDYPKGGGSNNPWCAVYVGPAPSPNTSSGGGNNVQGLGVAFIRLTQ